MVARERSAGCSCGSRRQLDSKGSIASSLEKTRAGRGEVSPSLCCLARGQGNGVRPTREHAAAAAAPPADEVTPRRHMARCVGASSSLLAILPPGWGATLTLCLLLLTAPPAAAQGPFDGLSKTTYASTQPWVGMAFIQRYFPTTCAQVPPQPPPTRAPNGPKPCRSLPATDPGLGGAGLRTRQRCSHAAPAPRWPSTDGNGAGAVAADAAGTVPQRRAQLRALLRRLRLGACSQRDGRHRATQLRCRLQVHRRRSLHPEPADVVSVRTHGGPMLQGLRRCARLHSRRVFGCPNPTRRRLWNAAAGAPAVV